MAIIICENCGSSFDENETKCPYCGYINESGAEKEYMKDLGKVCEDLDHVDEEQAEMYKDEARKKLKLVALIAGCIALAIVLFICVSQAYERRLDKIAYGDLSVDSMEEDTKNMDKMEEYYQAGDYDAAQTVFYEMLKNGSRSIYRWGHSVFILYREKYIFYFDSVENILQDNDEYMYAVIIGDIVELYSRGYLTQVTYATPPKEDLDVIETYRTEVLEDAKARFDLTDEMLEAYYQETKSDYSEVINLDKCLEIAKRWTEGKR